VKSAAAAGTKHPTREILHHWREAVPEDRLAHLVKDATRALVRALQMRLAEHGVSFGHWTFLRILWERDGLTQRELSGQAGVMEPTTFSALTAMEKIGYVRRRRVAENHKTSPCSHRENSRAEGRLVPCEDVNRVAVTNVGGHFETREILIAIIEPRATKRAPQTARAAYPRHGSSRVSSPRERSGARALIMDHQMASSPVPPGSRSWAAPLSLYVHIPWCLRKYPYCDQLPRERGGLPRTDTSMR
jgi:hypothetical protein